jgi:hypothetical protein
MEADWDKITHDRARVLQLAAQEARYLTNPDAAKTDSALLETGTSPQPKPSSSTTTKPVTMEEAHAGKVDETKAKMAQEAKEMSKDTSKMKQTGKTVTQTSAKGNAKWQAYLTAHPPKECKSGQNQAAFLKEVQAVRDGLTKSTTTQNIEKVINQIKLHYGSGAGGNSQYLEAIENLVKLKSGGGPSGPSGKKGGETSCKECIAAKKHWVGAEKKTGTPGTAGGYTAQEAAGCWQHMTGEQEKREIKNCDDAGVFLETSTSRYKPGDLDSSTGLIKETYWKSKITTISYMSKLDETVAYLDKRITFFREAIPVLGAWIAWATAEINRGQTLVQTHTKFEAEIAMTVRTDQQKVYGDIKVILVAIQKTFQQVVMQYDMVKQLYQLYMSLEGSFDVTMTGLTTALATLKEEIETESKVTAWKAAWKINCPHAPGTLTAYVDQTIIKITQGYTEAKAMKEGKCINTFKTEWGNMMKTAGVVIKSMVASFMSLSSAYQTTISAIGA